MWPVTGEGEGGGGSPEWLISAMVVEDVAVEFNGTFVFAFVSPLKLMCRCAGVGVVHRACAVCECE
jgi:hypothetical protein